MRAPVAINARAAVRTEAGGVERVARELASRLPEQAPGRYRVVAPPAALAHRAGHAWEQLALPLQAGGAQLILSPANTFPLADRRNVAFVHDLAPLVDPGWYSGAYGHWHRTLLRALRRARLAVAPSEAIRSDFVERLGVAPERTATVPLGVGSAFRAGLDPEPLRRRLDLSKPYVLFVGTAFARKNVALLDRAAPTLRLEGLDVVVAGGSRSYMADPTTGGARRLGYVSDDHLPLLYAGAAVFALPSLYEGFGLPCLEAMACGTPVVTTDRGGLPETCGDAALYVEPDDPDALARACLLAAFDPPTRSRLVNAGQTRAAAFSWDRTARLLDSAIATALAR